MGVVVTNEKKKTKKASGEAIQRATMCCLDNCKNDANFTGLKREGIQIRCNEHIEEYARRGHAKLKQLYPDLPEAPERVYTIFNPFYDPAGYEPYKHDEIIEIDCRPKQWKNIHPAFLLMPKVTLLSKIIIAIRDQPDWKTSGVSQRVILKCLLTKFGVDKSQLPAVKKAFERGLEEEWLVQSGGQFKATDDVALELHDPDHVDRLEQKRTEEWKWRREHAAKKRAETAPNAKKSSKAGEADPLDRDEYANADSAGKFAINRAREKVFEHKESKVGEKTNCHLISSSKVGLPTGELKDVTNEATCKVYTSRRGVLLLPNGNVPGKADVPHDEVVTQADFETKLTEIEESGVVRALTLHVCRPTDQDTAWELECAQQGYMNKLSIENFTEAPRWCKGSRATKSDFATASITVYGNAFVGVKEGKFFFNEDMPKFLKARLKKHFPWTREAKYWRKEASGAKERDRYNERVRRRERHMKREEQGSRKRKLTDFYALTTDEAFADLSE